jgi:hypothetical protein
MQNKELIALDQDPLGLQAYVVKRENGGYVLVKDVEAKYALKRAVAFYNPTNAPITMSISFEDLDLAGRIKVRDLFEKADKGIYEDQYEVTVPAHGTRIYRLEADERLERTLYEAETAWLSMYQELTNNEADGTATYTETTTSSGGAKVGWLGNRAENDLQWRNVHSFEGGDYTLRLSFICNEDRKVKISVNGGEPIEAVVNSTSWVTARTRDFNIHLNKGNNVIRLYSDEGWMPDIDCMRLIPAVPDAVQSVTDGKNFSAVPTDNGILIQTQVPTQVTVNDMSGRTHFCGKVEATLGLSLPSGYYIVNGNKMWVK